MTTTIDQTVKLKLNFYFPDKKNLHFNFVKSQSIRVEQKCGQCEQNSLKLNTHIVKENNKTKRLFKKY